MVLAGKPEKKRSRRKWDNIKMDPLEVVWRSMDLIDMAQGKDRRWVLVNAVMNLWVPKMRRIP
jgi:hypothetical protein